MPSDAERAALDRLDAWRRGDRAYPPGTAFTRDLDVLLALARRAVAAATPTDTEPLRDASVWLEGGADGELFAAWRAAVLEHERLCIAVDMYTPKDVYAEYLHAHKREYEASLALRAAIAPHGLGVIGARPTTPRDHAGGTERP
jgi:hypothetical protein